MLQVNILTGYKSIQASLNHKSSTEIAKYPIIVQRMRHVQLLGNMLRLDFISHLSFNIAQLSDH